MGKEETLLRIKATEAEIRALRAAAERDRDRIIREARREDLELREELRKDADEGYRAILTAAEGSVKTDLDRILAGGRAEAERIRSRGDANIDRAVELVVERFRRALNA